METNEKHIRDAWAFLRKNNNDIPDYILDLMRDDAIEKLHTAKQVKCPNCGNEALKKITIIKNGMEINIIYECCACEWQWRG